MLRVYGILLLPAHAVLLMSDVFTDSESLLGLSRIGGIAILACNILVLGASMGTINRAPQSRTVLRIIVLVLFVFLFQPLFGYLFSFQLVEFREYLKLATWMTTIPVASVLAAELGGMRAIKLSAKLSSVVLIAGFALVNASNLGRTAYDQGIFYIGYGTVAPLSYAMAMLIPLLILPYGMTDGTRIMKASDWFFIVFQVSIAGLLMKRATVIGITLSSIVILMLIGWHRHGALSPARVLVLVFGLVLCVGIGATYLVTHDTELVEARFRDVQKYEESGDARYIGSGRILLLEHFVDRFLEQPLMQKITGIDIFGSLDSPLQVGAHNDYVEIVMRYGLLGLAAYGWFLLTLARHTGSNYGVASSPLEVQVAAAMAGTLCIYLIASVAGVVFRMFAMTCFALMTGTLLAASTPKALAEKNVPTAQVK